MKHPSFIFQFFVELFILFRIQLSIVRHQLIWILGMATMFPFVTRKKIHWRVQ